MDERIQGYHIEGLWVCRTHEKEAKTNDYNWKDNKALTHETQGDTLRGPASSWLFF